MLPIRYRHYNPLTRQFEDECENHFNLLPTTSYPNFVSETNENDVEIERIKHYRDINLFKLQEKIQRVREVSENLREYMATNPGKKKYKISSYKSGWFGMYEAERMVAECLD